MNLRSFFPSIGTALLVGGAIACSDSTGPGVNTAFQAAVTTDLAPSAGAQVASDFAFYGGASSSGTGGSFSMNVPTGGTLSSTQSVLPPDHVALSWIDPSCTYNSSTQFFVCPIVSKNSHQYTVSYQLFDSLGTVQSAYNSVSTDSIHFVVFDTAAVAYTWNYNSYADTVSIHRNATLSNLKGNPDTVHVWNGTGAGAGLSIRQGQITRIYQLTSSDTTTDLTFRQPRLLNPYPLSGTIVRNYTIVRTREGSDTTHLIASRRVVVTFNGTVNVPMTVGGTLFMLNLDTHVVTKL